MACFHPLQAFRLASGEVSFVERGDVAYTLSLACGRCIGCRLERSRQWSVRIMHEASLYDGVSSFVTLTYDDQHVPADGSLHYRDFQMFMRRVRKQFGPTRFFMCGEYGDDLLRPHFHAGLFGVNFVSDRVYKRRTDGGNRVYTSDVLSKLWPHGLHEIGDLTEDSAGYMARYTFKKVTGDMADKHYMSVDRGTGEVVWRKPEFCHMSLKPGIGARWFERFRSDVFPHDRVVVKGRAGPVPRYYYTLLKRVDLDMLEGVQQERIQRAVARGGVDTTVERLADREKVVQARVALTKRPL